LPLKKAATDAKPLAITVAIASSIKKSLVAAIVRVIMLHLYYLFGEHIFITFEKELRDLEATRALSLLLHHLLLLVMMIILRHAN